VHYGDDPLALNWHNDGPYIFLENDSILKVNYIKGNHDEGYYLEQKEYPFDSLVSAKCYYPMDSSSFGFQIRTSFQTPNSTYDDQNKIFAISDIESNYKTFRDFLINSKVIDKNLNWTFGSAHLVLVGDFVDRGQFTTQTLWFIYKLEQEAEKQGGSVHFIIGNHELKNMHGNYGAAAPKYTEIASILNKELIELYDPSSIIGRWMASKNAIELINGNLFVHGGIHPDLADANLSLEEINHIIRNNYYQPFEPTGNQDDLLTSTKTGPCWYRGYFKDDLAQQEIENGLDRFNAKTVIVGHTLQSEVNRQYNGKVIAIDVHHPKDDHKNWPEGKSEALLIDGDKLYRVFANGDKEEI